MKIFFTNNGTKITVLFEVEILNLAIHFYYFAAV